MPLYVCGVTVEPAGALYILANPKKFADNSLEFSSKLLRMGVGVALGIYFGGTAEGYIRFYARRSLKILNYEGQD